MNSIWMEVACPFCHADVGDVCRSLRTGRKVEFHRQRVDAHYEAFPDQHTGVPVAKTKTVTYEPVDKDVASELIGEGVHVGLRKGSEDPASGPLWRMISESGAAWTDALNYCMWGLESMGYVLCRKTVVIHGEQVTS